MAIVSQTSGVLVINAAADGLRAAYGGLQFNIKSVRWVINAAAVAGDNLLLEDNQGNIIYEDVSDATGQYVRDFEFPDRFVDDLEIDTIDRGTLYIYLR